MAPAPKWISLLCVTALFFSGCADERSAKEISKIRRAGHWLDARLRAVDILTDESNRMLCWRELAYTDEALSRDKSLSTADQLRYLKEAALVCAAVCAHDKEQGLQTDFRWLDLATLLRTDLANRMTNVLTAVRAQERNETTHSVTVVPEELDKILGDQGPLKLYREDRRTWYETDPDQAERAIRVYSQLRPLLLRLPLATGETNGEASNELSSWADSHFLTLATVQSLYDDGAKVAAEAFDRATEDLQDLNYLQAATIFESEFLKK